MIACVRHHLFVEKQSLALRYPGKSTQKRKDNDQQERGFHLRQESPFPTQIRKQSYFTYRVLLYEESGRADQQTTTEADADYLLLGSNKHHFTEIEGVEGRGRVRK
jgi:hypothetical protein